MLKICGMELGMKSGRDIRKFAGRGRWERDIISLFLKIFNLFLTQ